MLSRTDLHAYQQRAAVFAYKTPYCALWLGLGLGKTISTLTAIADLLDSASVEKVLVVAPLRVANSVWAQEASNWSHASHLRVSVCTGTEKQRLAALNADADVYVINRENLVWLVKLYGNRWPFDMVALDEASGFKSSKAKRWRALKRVRPFIRRMVQLTGTMSPNGLIDLWAQVYLLDQGQRLGRTKTAFLDRWFESDYMGFKWTPRDGAEAEIHAAVSDIVLCMEAADYLDLPQRMDSRSVVAMTVGHQREYAGLERDFLLQLEGAEVEAFSAGALANKLLQYANGAIYTDDAGTWSEIHKGKLDALAEIVEDNPGEPLLIAYNYRTDLARIQARFPDAETLDAPDAIDRWNRGEIQMLVAHPASAGHGLNLQHGGSVIVWFGLNWSLELYQQFNGRLDRQGQTKPVRVMHIVTEGTIDERVLDAIDGKAKTQQDLIDAVKHPFPSSRPITPTLSLELSQPFQV